MNTLTSYRLDGASPQLTVTRQGANAAAKVDNYNDPLAATEIAWSQTSDQYFSSLKDSGGTNPDLYRTVYAYNGYHQPVDSDTPASEQHPSYADAIKSTYFLKGYWRLGETSGTTAADSSGNGLSGSYVNSPTLGSSGALARDPDTSVALNGTTGYASVPGTSLGTISGAFTVEAWVKPTSATAAMTAVGSRGTGSTYGFDMKFTGGNKVHADIGSGTSWLTTSAEATFSYATNRWYHLAYAVGNGAYTIYLDGSPIGAGSFSGTPLLTDSTHNLYIGQNGTGAEYWAGSIDEVAVYTAALDANRIRAHYLAGRAIAEDQVQPTYDAEGHTIAADDEFLTNGGFESGLTGWQNANGAAAYYATSPSSDPNVHYDPSAPTPSYASLNITNSAYVNQDVQLLAGQTFRIQFWHKSAAGVHATYSFYYWDTSAKAWGAFFSTYSTATSWTSEAWDLTVPINSDGRVRLSFWNDAANGTAYFDDAVIVTGWAKNAYASNGLLTDRTSFNTVGAGGSNALPTLTTHTGYNAGADYPAIFPTSSAANYVSGGPVAPDQNVTTTAIFDTWGRTLQTTDPDGAKSPTSSYSPSGNETDLDHTSDVFANTTSYTHDAVGNRLTSVLPLGETTANAYDALNHLLRSTAPDGTITSQSYNGFGQLASSIANYVGSGTPSGASGTDNLTATTSYDELGRAVQTDTDTGYSGALDAQARSSYDLLDNATSSTVYAGSAGTSPRTTTNHFETYTAGTTYSREKPSAVGAPIAPTGSPAPACPDGAGYCNSVDGLDFAGRALTRTDAYGNVTALDYNFAGQPVRSIVDSDSSTSGHGANNDKNLTTTTSYDLLGRVTNVVDPSGRSSATAYDNLGRPTLVTRYDSAGAAVSDRKTVYLASGRIDRLSSTDATGTADAARTWTRTLYDAAGRAYRTIVHDDIAGNAGMSLATFEGGTGGWSGSASGWYTTNAATIGLDATGARTGLGRLHVTSSAGGPNSGAWWDLSGQAFQAGHAYRVHADLLGPSGSSVSAYLGQDVPNSTNGGSETAIALGGAWQPIDFTWTPSAALSSPVHFAVRHDTAGAIDFYLDNVVVWDTNAGWSDVNVPGSETIYDADGRAAESILPPGVPGTDEPQITATGYDPLGRPTTITVNATSGASGSYASLVRGTAGLVGYWRLNEPSGTSAGDVAGGLTATLSGGVSAGAPGALANGPTSAMSFDGATGYLAASSPATTAVDNFSLEAWFKLSAAPADHDVIVKNGDASSGYGLDVNAAGHLEGIFDPTTYLDTGVSVSLGVWHHAALVRSAGTTRIYLDGAQAGGSWTAAPIAPASSFTIGRDGAAAGRFFPGSLEEIAVYAAPLAAAQVLAHDQAGSGSASSDTNLTTAYAYDALGRRTDMMDPAGIETHYGYDRLGHLTSTIADYADGVASSISGDDDVKSTYALDTLGELTGYCPALQLAANGCDPTSTSSGLDWRFGYDADGRETSQVPPVNTVATPLDSRLWSYDAGGRLLSTTDQTAAGSTDRHTDATFDALGRILGATTYAGVGTGSPKLSTTSVYNLDGTPASVSFDGTASGEGTDALTYAYDPAGRLSSLKRGATTLTGVTYNPDDTIATRTDGTLGTSTFGYDWAHREASATPPASFASGSLTLSYRDDGLLAAKSYPNGETASLSYDAAKRPTAVTYASAGSLSQSYDRVGDVVAEPRTLAGVSGDNGTGVQSFTYDRLRRVTGSSGLGAGSTADTYDLDSNRLSATSGGTTTSYAYDRTDALVSETAGSTTAFAYDAYGEMTAKAEPDLSRTTYAYDLAGRLISVSPASGPSATFSLDALGRARTRTIGSSVDTYGYLGPSETAYEIANAGGSGTTTDALLDAAGSRLASKTGAALEYLLFDLHGDVAGAESATGSVSDAFRYDPYGQTLGTPLTSSLATPWRYQGRLDLSPSSVPLYDAGARLYAPSLGAFTSLDTVAGSAQDPASMNRYLYAAADPTTLVDPDGHMARMLYTDGGNEDVSATGMAIWHAELQRYVDRRERLAESHWLRAGTLLEVQLAQPRYRRDSSPSPSSTR